MSAAAAQAALRLAQAARRRSALVDAVPGDLAVAGGTAAWLELAELIDAREAQLTTEARHAR